MFKGSEQCFDKTQTVVQDAPKEECTLEPQRTCEHVTKLVPKLEPSEECVDVPKEVCTRFDNVFLEIGFIHFLLNFNVKTAEPIRTYYLLNLTGVSSGMEKSLLANFTLCVRTFFHTPQFFIFYTSLCKKLNMLIVPRKILRNTQANLRIIARKFVFFMTRGSLTEKKSTKLKNMKKMVLLLFDIIQREHGCK